MKVIAFCARKGGAGKTTLATQFTGMAVKRGMTVRAFDLDPQGSFTTWVRLRARAWDWQLQGHDPVRMTECRVQQLAETVDHARRYGETSLVIIDTPPTIEAPVLAAARVADVILVPTRTSAVDLRAIATTIDVVRPLCAETYVVLNACRANDPDVADAREVLTNQMGVMCAPDTVGDRVAFRRTQVDGGTVARSKRDRAAYEELSRLFKFAVQRCEAPAPASHARGHREAK